MEATQRPTVVCVTPVKNEAWILERFLSCAALWADQVIVADQGSTDGSAEIARRFEKVRVIENPVKEFGESQRQKLLLQAARELPGPRLIVALDADEFLTANFLGSPEWHTMLRAPRGANICFRWVNVGPDMTGGWDPEIDFPLGFMDDGTEHDGAGARDIHNWRVPTPAGAPRILLRDIKVLHYQYTDWQRMKSKVRWYQCWERMQDPQRSAVDIFRQYHHMYAVPEKQRCALRPEWLAGYTERGIDMTSVYREGRYYWDAEVAGWLAQRGPAFFAKLDIWWMDWDAVYREAFGRPAAPSLKDPRTAQEREINDWLRATQARATEPEVVAREKELKAAGW